MKNWKHQVSMPWQLVTELRNTTKIKLGRLEKQSHCQENTLCNRGEDHCTAIDRKKASQNARTSGANLIKLFLEEI